MIRAVEEREGSRIGPDETHIGAVEPDASCVLAQSMQGESFLGRKWLIGKKIKKELDKPEGISHAKMV